MTKIALLGAGSVVFASRLISDIFYHPELRQTTISLMDINHERLNEMFKAEVKWISF